MIVPLCFNSAYINYFSQAKWIALYVMTAIAVVMTGLETFVLPKLSRLELTLFIAIIAVYAQNVLRFGIANQDIAIQDRLIFLIWVVLWFRTLQIKGFLTTLAFAIIACAAVVDVVGYVQYFGWDLVPRGPSRPASLFGNVNNAAEFLAYSMAFAIIAYRNTSVNRVKIGIEVFIGATLSFLVYLACRSANLGLLVAIPFLLIAFRPFSKWAYARILFFANVAFCSVKIAEFLRYNQTWTSGYQRQIGIKGMESINSRLAIWQDSLQTALDQPTGVGAGNFNFGHVLASLKNYHPIDEFMLWEHPHNEVLRMIAEDGWIFAFAVLVFIASVALRVVRKWRFDRTGEPLKLLIGLTIILIPSALTAFPTRLPGEFLIVTLIIALAFTVIGDVVELRRRPVVGFGFAVMIALLLLSTAYRLDYGESALRDPTANFARSERACDLLPRWQVCLKAIEYNIMNSEWDKAQYKLDRILSAQPYNYMAFKAKANLAMKQNQGSNACATVWAYEAIVGDSRSFDVTARNVCNPLLLEELARSEGTTPLGKLAQVMKSRW